MMHCKLCCSEANEGSSSTNLRNLTQIVVSNAEMTFKASELMCLYISPIGKHLHVFVCVSESHRDRLALVHCAGVYVLSK